MSGLMGGLIGAGIGGLLFGHGFFGGMAGFGGFFGFLIQIFLVVMVVRWLMRRFLNRAAGDGRRAVVGRARWAGRHAPGGAGGLAAAPARSEWRSRQPTISSSSSC